MNRSTFSMALAVFSMFFGAGNAIFPLILGMQAKSQYDFAFCGLVVTAIGGPLLGLLGVTLYQGKFLDFFDTVGKIPRILLIALTLALLGPFAVLPRCITVAYSATGSLLPGLPLWFFGLLFCFLALILSWKQRFILPTLGLFLSPLLIGCLLLIIYMGCSSSNAIACSELSSQSAFLKGLTTGYDTMDLIASIYFSSGLGR